MKTSLTSLPFLSLAALLLLAAGCARIYTPKDYDITAIMGDIVDLLDGKPKAA